MIWRLLRPSARKTPPPPASSHAASAAGETIRACAHCGVHVPESEAVLCSDGTFYCSERHLRMARNQEEKP
ncbi:MAG: hypothetical protein LBG69_06315 [Zoogloeaceae bacterium]|nr:hypothetical protein [Zoogloeaceae bacterium]